MRHRMHYRGLNRTMEHRWALRRNMAQSLFEHGQISTTVPKAKNLRPFVEKLLTMAIKVRRAAAEGDTAGSLRMRRQLHKLLGERSIIPKEHQAAYNDMSDSMRAKTVRMASGRRYRTGEPKGRLAFTGESLMHRLIEKVAPRFADRQGGYTRIVKLAKRRLGDQAPVAILQLVGDETGPGSVAKPAKSARRRRADARYTAAVKAAKNFGRKTEESAG